MSQFRPIQSFQQSNRVDLAEEEVIEEVPISPPITTSPLIFFPGVRTEPLISISNESSRANGPLSLTEALRSAMFPNAAERVVIIPGSRKHGNAKLDAPKRRMSRRLRQCIILSTLLCMLILTFSSLAPLANGQAANPIFTGFTNLVSLQQITSQIQSHFASIAQNNPGIVQPTATPVTQNSTPPMDLPKSQYVAIAQQDASAVGIPADYFVRQINAESGFNPNAVSPAGAVGIAQFLPSTAANLGINPWDPVDALRGAARLMASYAHTYGGDYAKALAAYNGGSGTVQNAVNACGANWMNCLPGETRNYIYKIMGI
jgi:hypothetical protein